MAVDYHIAAGSSGILVSFQDGIRLKTLFNWVTQCVSAVRGAEREKSLDQGDIEAGVVPKGRLNTQC